MDLSKRYKDIDGNDCNIRQMVLRNLEWSCNRIQEGEQAIERVAELERWLANGVYFTNEEFTQHCSETVQALKLKDARIVAAESRLAEYEKSTLSEITLLKLHIDRLTEGRQEELKHAENLARLQALAGADDWK